MSLHLTAKQQDALNFLREYFQRNDQLPPYITIAVRFGWASHTAAWQVLQALEVKGYVERNECGKFRFVRPIA